MSKFMHILCELPDRVKANRFYAIAALAFFAGLAVFFYAPWGSGWQVYGTDDWDYSNFMHAVPAWSLKYFHRLPLWDPYLRGGSTLIGNPQNPAPLSLTFLMSLIAGPVAGIKIGNILNAVIGMAGMYVLLRYFDAIWIARVLAGAILALNGTVVYHTSQGQFMWMMTMYWPWMLLFFLKGLKERLWIYAAALMLSLQFWGGGTYPFAFALSAFGLLAVLLALRDKKGGYLMRWAEMLAAFVVFSAPRLFMVMETLYRFPRVTVNEDAQVPGSVFYYALLCRDQIHNHIPGLKIDEVATYVGLIPCLLAAALFFQWRKFWPYLCVLIFSLALALGNSPGSVLWPVFHLLGGGYFHFSTRSLLISVFFIAMAAGLSLSYLVVRWGAKYPAVAGMACATAIFVLVDLCVVLAPVRNFAVTNAAQHQHFDPANPFSQLEVTEKERYRFGNSSMLDLLLHNTGTSNGYDALPIPVHVLPRNSAGYRGEFYFQNGGVPQIVSWQPDRWQLRLGASTTDILVVNQNFDPGWKTDPPAKLVNAGGLLGRPVSPSDRSMVFYYLPFNFVLGCWVSFLGLLAAGWDIYSVHRRRHAC